MIKNIIYLAGLATSSVSATTCRALAMSGGGSKGAFEMGVLYGMYHAKPGSDFDYDVVTGVSAGAINAGALSVFPKHDTANTLQIMSDTWEHLTTGNLYKQWSILREADGVVNHSGIYNTEPLYDFVKKFFADHGNTFYRKLTVAAGNINNGNYELFTEKSDDVPKAIVSSASIPFIFPNQNWGNGLVVMDGGTMYNTNLVSAIERCKEIVDDEADIILDIIVCSAHELPKWESRKNAMENYLRFEDAKTYNNDMADILNFKQGFPKVQFRYYVEPTGPLVGALKMIDANNATTYPMQMQGRADGAAIVGKGEGYFFEKMDEWNESADLQKEYPQVGAYLRHHFKLLKEESPKAEETSKTVQKKDDVKDTIIQ